MQDCKKPGRPPSAAKARLRERMPQEWSARTFETFWHAFRMWADLSIDGLATEDDWRALIKAAERPNGSLNVSKLERLTGRFVMTCILGVEQTI